MSTEPVIAAVPITLLDVVWPVASEHLQRVVDVSNDELSLKSIYDEIARGDSLLITVSKGPEVIAATILEMRTFATGIKAMYIPVVGGDEMDTWLERFFEVCKQIALEHDCTRLRGVAVRKGWLKKLEPLGWTEAHTVIECKIGDE